MKITVCSITVCLMAGYGVAAAHTVLTENKAGFLKQCRKEVLSARGNAVTWIDEHCVTKWKQTENAASMAEAILAFVQQGEAGPSPEAARARLPMISWSANRIDGTLHDLRVHLPDTGGEIVFYWQQQGAEVPYNVISALRIRSVELRTLGCPQYPGASMGREKVLSAISAGGTSFTFTLYSRPAPTGIGLGVYVVNVGYGGIAPDRAALREGHYPGGGGRAFAVEPTGWTQECSDPD